MRIHLRHRNISAILNRHYRTYDEECQLTLLGLNPNGLQPCRDSVPRTERRTRRGRPRAAAPVAAAAVGRGWGQEHLVVVAAVLARVRDGAAAVHDVVDGDDGVGEVGQLAVQEGVQEVVGLGRGPRLE